MRTPKYRVYVKHWGNSENDGMEYPKLAHLNEKRTFKIEFGTPHF